MTPDRAASTKTVNDWNQTGTNLTVAVIVLAIVVVLLVVAGFVYFILRRMTPQAKIAPAPPEPNVQNLGPEVQRSFNAGELSISFVFTASLRVW